MNIAYRRMNPDDAVRVCELVDAVFSEYEAPHYSRDGILEFREYNRPEKMAQRLTDDHFALLAICGSEIAGVIEIRKNRHISLFFVSSRFQGKGIGKELWSRAARESMNADASVTRFTVHASPHAEKIYARLGFSKTAAEQTANGIRFIPMARNVPLQAHSFSGQPS